MTLCGISHKFTYDILSHFGSFAIILYLIFFVHSIRLFFGARWSTREREEDSENVRECGHVLPLVLGFPHSICIISKQVQSTKWIIIIILNLMSSSDEKSHQTSQIYGTPVTIQKITWIGVNTSFSFAFQNSMQFTISQSVAKLRYKCKRSLVKFPDSQ